MERRKNISGLGNCWTPSCCVYCLLTVFQMKVHMWKSIHFLQIYIYFSLLQNLKHPFFPEDSAFGFFPIISWLAAEKSPIAVKWCFTCWWQEKSWLWTVLVRLSFEEIKSYFYISNIRDRLQPGDNIHLCSCTGFRMQLRYSKTMLPGF